MGPAQQVHPSHDIVGWAADTATEKDANNVVDSMLHKIPDVSTESPAVREQVARLDRTILSWKNKLAAHSPDHPVARKVEGSVILGHAILERYSITASQDDFRKAIHSFRSARQISGQADDKAAAASLGIARCYCQRYQHFGSSRDRGLAQTEFFRLYTQGHASAALPYLGLLTAWEAEYNPRIDEIEEWLGTIISHLSHLARVTDETAELNVGAEPSAPVELRRMTAASGNSSSSKPPPQSPWVDRSSKKISSVRDLGGRIRSLKLWSGSSLAVGKRADRDWHHPRFESEPTSSPSFLREDPSGSTNTEPGPSDKLEDIHSSMRQTLDSTSSLDLLLYLEAQGRLLLHRSRLLGIYPDLDVAISTFYRYLRLSSEKQ